MEQLTQEEIEMCQIAVSYVAEYKLNNNKGRWENLWDKLQRMQSTCLTPLALDVCPRCQGAGRYSDIIGMRFCLLCDGTGKRK